MTSPRTGLTAARRRFLPVLAAVFFYALDAGGGLERMARTIAASEAFGPDHLDPLGATPVVAALGLFFVFAVGTLGQPHMLHKFFMLDDPRKLKWMPLAIGERAAMFAKSPWSGVITGGTNLAFTAPGMVSIVASQAGSGNSGSTNRRYRPRPIMWATIAIRKMSTDSISPTASTLASLDEIVPLATASIMAVITTSPS